VGDSESRQLLRSGRGSLDSSSMAISNFLDSCLWVEYNPWNLCVSTKKARGPHRLHSTCS